MRRQSTTQLLASMFCVMGQLAQALLATEGEDVDQPVVYEDDDPESFREYGERVVAELRQRVDTLEERLRALEGRPQGPMPPYRPDWTWRPKIEPTYAGRNTNDPPPQPTVVVSSQWTPQEQPSATMTSTGDGTAWVMDRDGAA